MDFPSPRSRPFVGAWLAVALHWLIAGCAPLQPVAGEPVPPSRAVDSTFWQAALPDTDQSWHLLLDRGERALDLRLLAIDSAQQSIDLQTFLLTPDAVGSAVLLHLVAAAERGVRVRFLIDDSFMRGDDDLLLYLHEHDNIEFRVFNPYQRRASDAVARQLLNLAEFHRLDHRMHNKAMIVDGNVAIVGGRNLADEYFGLHDEANFRDLELLVGGDIVSQIGAAFADYWNAPWSVPIETLAHLRTENTPLEALRASAAETQALHTETNERERVDVWTRLTDEAIRGRTRLLVDSPPQENPALATEAPVQVAQDLLELIDSARSQIVLISAYLIPTLALEDAVRRAVERGVEVRLLTNSIRSNNHLTAHSAYRNHIETLLLHGAALYEIRVDAEDRPVYIRAPVSDKRLALHAKALLVDDELVFIGSANLDPRSLRINTEMGLLVQSRELNAQLAGAVSRDFREVNAWRLRFDDRGRVNWVSGDVVLTSQPADSAAQLIEDWFFALMPIEAEL